MLFWNIILEGKKSPILSVFVALTLLSVFPATAPRGAFPDDRVIIILVEVGGIDCDMPHAEISVTHTNTCLLGSLPSRRVDSFGFVWTCVFAQSSVGFIYLFIFPYGEFVQNVNVSFSLHAGVSRRRSRGVCYIYQVVFEHLKLHFPIRRICSLFKVFTLTFSIFRSKHVASNVARCPAVCNSLKLYVWTNSQTQVSKRLHKYVQFVGGLGDKVVVKAKGSVFFPPMIVIESSTGTQRTNQQRVRLPPSRISGFYKTFPWTRRKIKTWNLFIKWLKQMERIGVNVQTIYAD